MEWNNGKERAKFEKEQARLREEYLAAGMTEEQIQELREFDEDWYNGRRREAEHTQRLDMSAFEDSADGDSKNPLYKKFLHNFSVEDKHWEDERFGWIEEIEDKDLYKAVKSLTEREREILTCYLYDGLTLTEIGEHIGVTQQAVSKKLNKFRKIFEKWL